MLKLCMELEPPELSRFAAAMGKPMAAKALGLLPQERQNDLALWALQTFRGRITQVLADAMAERHIPGRILYVQGSWKDAGKTAMLLEVLLEGVTPEGIFEVALPELPKLAGEKPGLQLLRELAREEPGTLRRMVAGACGALSPQKQEELLCRAAEAFREPIHRAIAGALEKNGLPVSIREIRLVRG